MILGKKWKFLKKNSRAGSRFLGVPQVNQAGLVKTSARKKGIRAEAESLLGVLIKLNYDRIVSFYFSMKWSFCERKKLLILCPVYSPSG